MEWPEDLLHLFDDPLLEDVLPKSAAITPDDRRVKALIEITQWVEAHEGRMPQCGGDLKEKMLARSLVALKRDANEGLKAYDYLQLLNEEEKV